MSGLLHVKLAKVKKCRIAAADINKTRLELAMRLGAENIPERKADAVFLCTSALSAVDRAWKCVDKGGCIVFFAVPGPEKLVTVPINDFWTQEIRILTSYYCGPADITEAIWLLETRRIEVDDLITHRLPLRDIEKGFRLVIEGRESIKVIIRPREGE
jgi:L-iditol 2-dehydrogenase